MNLNLYNKNQGTLFTEASKLNSDSCLATIFIKDLLTEKLFTITTITFDQNGNRALICDRLGKIYLFNFLTNKFFFIIKINQPCVALHFNSLQSDDIIIAHSDSIIECYNIESGKKLAELKGHNGAIINLCSSHLIQRLITSSSDIAQIWRADTYERLKRLKFASHLKISLIYFTPDGKSIVSCFQDNRIFIWDSLSLEMIGNLEINSHITNNVNMIKDFTISERNNWLIAGGRCKTLLVWNLKEKTLSKMLQLVENDSAVKKLRLITLGNEEVLVVFNKNGQVFFISMDSFTISGIVSNEFDKIVRVEVCPLGRHLITIHSSGTLKIVGLQSILDFGGHQKLKIHGVPVIKIFPSNISKNYQFNDSKVNKTKTKNAKHCGQNFMNIINIQNEFKQNVSREKLLSLLNLHGEYPSKYRFTIWRLILSLPENVDVYMTLVKKGTHHLVENIPDPYSFKSRKLIRNLKRTLSAIAFWNPSLLEIEYLSKLIFPFIEIYQNNSLVAFEVILSIIVNWSKYFYEDVSLDKYLSLIDKLISFFDPSLYNHFIKYRIKSKVYAWPLLKTLFFEVLDEEDWLCLLDNILSKHPAFLVSVITAFLIKTRLNLIQLFDNNDFLVYYQKKALIDIKSLLKEAYYIYGSSPLHLDPRNHIDEFKPLESGLYPILKICSPILILNHCADINKSTKDMLEDIYNKRPISMQINKRLSNLDSLPENYVDATNDYQFCYNN